MNNLKRFLSYLVKPQISVADLIPIGFIIGAIQHQHYITAVIIFIIGSVFCEGMVKLNKAIA